MHFFFGKKLRKTPYDDDDVPDAGTYMPTSSSSSSIIPVVPVRGQSHLSRQRCNKFDALKNVLCSICKRNIF